MDQVSLRRPLTVTWRSYELNPDGRKVDPAKAAMVRSHFPKLQKLASTHGVAMANEPARLGVNTRAAHEAAHFVAENAPSRDGDFHRAVYRHHFVNGGDISDRGALLKLAGDVGGIDVAELARALEDRRHRDAVLVDQREAAVRGLHGVPAIFARDRLLTTGFLPAPELLGALEALDATRS